MKIFLDTTDVAAISLGNTGLIGGDNEPNVDSQVGVAHTTYTPLLLTLVSLIFQWKCMAKFADV